MSYFLSGLSAIQNLTPPPSPTQLVRPDSPILPTHDAETDITDKDQNSSQALGAERPKLRKRRSSLTVNTSPLVQLKGSYRGATTATQKQNRSRSGSVNDFTLPRPARLPIEEVKVIGRLRSGSLGNSLRPRRVIRGARPPPSTPLPPLPAVPPSVPYLDGVESGTDPTRRRPLVSKTSTLENIGKVSPSSSAVFHQLNTGFSFKSMFNGSEDLVMKEN